MMFAGKIIAGKSNHRNLTLANLLQPELLRKCVHCGLCTSACPTYLETFDENDSPRGRVYLLYLLQQDKLPLTRQVRRHLLRCLDCRSCETACPSGVRYGQLIEAAHWLLHDRKHRPDLDLFRQLVLLRILPYRNRMRLALAPVRLLQKIGLFGLVMRKQLWQLLPAPLNRMLRLLPDKIERHKPLPAFLPAKGRCRARVAFFVGCVADVLMRDIHWASVRVLQENGCDVIVPPGQQCCGAIHLHTGDPEGARRLADANLAAFDLDQVDAIVVNHAGCGAMLKNYGHYWCDELQEERVRFAAKVRDINEFLCQLGVFPPSGKLELTAVYHDACHLAHAQQITAEPRMLLKMIPGLKLLDLPESTICCGSAGTYNLLQAEMADRLARRKVDSILSTGAQVVIASNAGCILQIQAELRSRNLTLPVLHPMQLLDASYNERQLLLPTAQSTS